MEQELDQDYVFQMPKDTSAITFKTQVQRLAKQYPHELAQAQCTYGKRNMHAPRIDLCRGHYSRGECVMRWSKKGEADGVWNEPLQVIIQEDQRVV